MGPKWPIWAQSCPPKRNYSHEEKYGEGSKNGARKGPNSWLFDFLSMIRWFIVNAFKKRNETKRKMQQNRNMDG